MQMEQHQQSDAPPSKQNHAPSSLTAEQRQRIERNRWVAIGKRYCKELGSKLSSPQQDAICIMGDALIQSGPGSGKTAVLVSMIQDEGYPQRNLQVHRVHLLLKQGVPPESIAVLSFTNRGMDQRCI